MGAEIKSNTEKKRNITTFSNQIFLSSSKGSNESAHGHILARTLTALKRDEKMGAEIKYNTEK